MLGDHTGVAAMVRSAVWLDDQLGLEILFIGRGGLDRENTSKLEASGKHLTYIVVLDNTFVFLYAQVLDSCEEPELLWNAGDTVENWRLICRIVGGLERNGVRCLQRPIEVGEGGPNSWVIA